MSMMDNGLHVHTENPDGYLHYIFIYTRPIGLSGLANAEISFSIYQIQIRRRGSSYWMSGYILMPLLSEEYCGILAYLYGTVTQSSNLFPSVWTHRIKTQEKNGQEEKTINISCWYIKPKILR